jgi:hypothetical protein
MQSALAALPTLNTLIPQSLQIDQATSGTLNPQDANLFMGADPADGTPSFSRPTGGPSTFIDWNDLAGDLVNHQLLDLDLASGKDPDSFPQSNECVAESNVLSKMDLRYVAAANNNKYAYFAVLRSDHNGDAGYYWLFTRLPPKQIQGQAPCNASQQRLLYDLSVGDVLLGGHFHPNGTPLLRIFTARIAAPNVTAVNAIDFTNSALWQENAAGVAAVAVNTTVTAPGAFGSAGATLSGTNLDTELFAEAAVDVNIFTGGQNCGAVFFGSVITRSSGSGGTSPDLKDLAGPAVFNFGQPTATAQLTPTCTQDVEFAVTGATGPLGDPIPLDAARCTWTFDTNPPLTASTCSGRIRLPTGSHTARVAITNLGGVSACNATATAAPVQVFEPPSVRATLAPTCERKFTYSATTSGGSGNSTLQWSFSGGGTVSPSSSTSPSGEVVVGTGDAPYEARVTSTDTRPDGLVCRAEDTKTIQVVEPLTVTAALAATCDRNFNFSATTAGGSGAANTSLLWSFSGGGTVSPSTSTAASGQVVVGTGNVAYEARVTATDRRPDGLVCTAPDTETIQVIEPLTVAAALAPTCDRSFKFSAATAGGNGTTALLWTFSGGGTVSPSSSTAASGEVVVGTGDVGYQATITARDTRSDVPQGFCTAQDNKTIQVIEPLTVTAALTPTCERNFKFAATTGGGSGAANTSLLWSFSGGGTVAPSSSTSASGEVVVGTGDVGYEARVTATDRRPDGLVCTAPDTKAIRVIEPLTATATLTPTCERNFRFAAATAGGSGNTSLLWSFSGGGTVSPSNSTSASGEVVVGTGDVAYEARLTATDTRPDGLVCPAPDTKTIEVIEPLTVSAALTPTCERNFKFSASTAGGSGAANTSLLWNFSGGGTVSPSSSTSASGEVVVGTGDVGYEARITATDRRPNGLECTAPDTKTIQVIEPLTVAATLTPTCERNFKFSAATAGGSGVANTSLLWNFSGGGTVSPSSSTAASGEVVVGTGDVGYEATLMATDTRPDGLVCRAPATRTIQVVEPLTVTATLTPTCEGKFTYSAATAGGTGNTSLFWSFAGGGQVFPSTSTLASGEVLVDTGNVSYRGSVMATDARPDGLICPAPDAREVVPFHPVRVNLALVAQAPICPAMNSAGDGISYRAIVSGGTGVYAMDWIGPACSGFDCVIDPSDSTFCHSQTLSVTATDGNPLCPPAISETESYAKVTTVTASDN